MSELFGCFLMFSATVISTTSSAEEESEDSNVERVMSSDSTDDSHSKISNSFNFAKTSDSLERLLVTKQRSLHHVIVIRRPRRHSTTSLMIPEHIPLLSVEDGGAYVAGSVPDSVFPRQDERLPDRYYGSL